VVKPKRDFFPTGIDAVQSEIDVILPDKNQVKLKNGKILNYDILIVATGSKINPAEIEGLQEDHWHKNIFDFYTFEGDTD